MGDGHADRGPVGLRQRRGNGGAAAEQEPHGAQVVRAQLGSEAGPHRGDGAGDRHPLGRHQPQQVRRFRGRAGQHQRGARHHRAVGQAPGAGVEHRDDREDDVAFAEADQAGREGAQAVQHGGPVAVEHAFGRPGRAGGVAEAGGQVLLREREAGLERARDRIGRRDQLVVVRDPGVRRDFGVGAVGQHHPVPHLRQFPGTRPDPREQPAVDEHHVVLGVVDDVLEVLRREPDVDRVQHPLGGRHGEVELQVAAGVARERPDARAGRDPQGVQRGGEAADVAQHLGVRAPFARRHDFLVREEPLGPVQDVGDGERPRLHQPVHDRLFRSSGVPAGTTLSAVTGRRRGRKIPLIRPLRCQLPPLSRTPSRRRRRRPGSRWFRCSCR